MRILVVGAVGSIGAGALTEDAHVIVRVDGPSEALERVDGPEEETLVLLPMYGPGGATPEQLRSLAARGSTVIVLAATESATARVEAFAHGACDVLFPPHEPDRLIESIRSFLPGRRRRYPRFSTDFDAIIAREGGAGAPFPARIQNLSHGGFLAAVDVAVEAGSVLRVAVRPPSPHTLPVLFGRVLASEPEPEGKRWLLHGHLVGLTDEEKEDLRRLLDALAANSFDPMAALRLVEALDVRALRSRPRQLEDHLPLLTAAEVSVLEGEGPLCEVVLLRCRLQGMASLVEAHPAIADGKTRLRLQESEEDARAARTLVGEILTAAAGRGDAKAMRDAREVQRLLEAAADRLQRVGALYSTEGRTVVTRIPLAESPAMPVYERQTPLAPAQAPVSAPAPLSPVADAPNRTARLALLACVALAASGALWYVRAELTRTRSGDVAREVESRSAALEVEGVRVEALFRDHRRTVAVVDASWYRASPEQRLNAARAIRAAQQEGTIVIRDVKGRTVGQLKPSGSGGKVDEISLSEPPRTPR